MANSTPSIVSPATIQQASTNNPALRTLLTQLVTASNTQATKTSTSNKNAPNQSSALVTFQNPLYLLTFTDPGGATAMSPSQAAQQAANSTLGANSVQSVIYHQVQAATSILFDNASGVQLFGGDSGTLNTQFVMSGLDTSKSWFFQIRTSFDGITWNQWKNVNNGIAVSGNPNGVVEEPINGGQFASITLPGKQIVGFGIGQIPSGGSVQTAQGVLLANSLGIAAPAGLNDSGNRVSGIAACSINGLGVATLTYVDIGSTHAWDGSLNYLLFGWVDGSQGIAEQVLADGGRWVTITLAGGTQVAIGQGTLVNGATFDVPPGYTLANTMGVCTPGFVATTGNYAHGVLQCNVVNGLCTFLFSDNSGNHWPPPGTGTINWFAIAWPVSLTPNVVTVGTAKFLLMPTASGNIAIGVGQTPSGQIMPLPPGFTYPECLAFSTPATYNEIGSYIHGIKVCNIDAGLPSSVGTCTLIYTDGTETVWNGDLAWMAVAWE